VPAKKAGTGKVGRRSGFLTSVRAKGDNFSDAGRENAAKINKNPFYARVYLLFGKRAKCLTPRYAIAILHPKILELGGGPQVVDLNP